MVSLKKKWKYYHPALEEKTCMRKLFQTEKQPSKSGLPAYLTLTHFLEYQLDNPRYKLWNSEKVSHAD